MAYVLFPVIQFTDDNGAALASGDVLTYVGGTTTPAATYSNSTGTAAANPVVLDASGRPNNGTGLWLDSTVTYKFIIRDSNDNELQTIDNYAAAGGDLTQLATNVSFVTLGSTSLLASERVLTAGSGISLTDAGAGSTVTAAVNINGLTVDSTPDRTADYVATYDASAAGNKKVLLETIVPLYYPKTGKWYPSGVHIGPSSSGQTSASATAIGTVNYTQLLFPKTVTLSSLTVEVTTLQAAKNLRLGIYAASTTTGEPTGAALVDSGNISTASAGVKTFSTSQVLQAGTLYWLAFNTDADTAQFAKVTPTAGTFMALPYLSAHPAITSWCIVAFTQSSAFGAFPTAASLTAIGANTATTLPALGVVLA